MTVQELLSILTRGFFLLLGFLSFLDYLQHRDAIKRDVALAVNSIALNMGIIVLNQILPLPAFIMKLGTLTIFAQPYLFLRLTNYLQAVPKRIQQLAFISMLIVWVLGLFPSDPTNRSVPILLSMIAYFVLINAYIMVRFLKGVRKTTGLIQQRLRLCAIGTGLFALALLLITPLIFQPSLQSIVIIPIGLAAIFSALCFLFGFVPPRWLQRIWQFTELRNFLSHLNQESAAAWLSTTTILTELAVAAERISGGIGSLVLARHVIEGKWQTVYQTEALTLDNSLIEASKLVDEAWKNGSAAYLSAKSKVGKAHLSLLETVPAEAVLIIPIHNPEHLLLVFLAQPLFFPEDDRELLSVLAQQAGTILENIDLVEQLQAYSGSLEQKVVERAAALEQSEERFRSIFEQAAVGIAEVALEGRFIQMNQRFCDILGYSKEAMQQLSFQDITHPDDLEADLNNVNALIAGTIANYSMQKRYYHKTGRIVWVNLTVSLMNQKIFGSQYLIKVVEDITEQKLAETAQRQAEQRFARVLDNTAEAVITIDVAQQIILFNQSAEKIFGYKAEEALGQNLEMFLPPDVIARHHRYLSNFADGSDIARGMGHRNKELYAKRRDGSIFPIEASISKLTENTETILTVFIRDISEQKRAAAALQASEGRYHHIIDNMLESFQIIGFDWRYLYVNEAAARYGHVTREELLGHTLMEKYPGIETTEMFAALRHTMETRVTQHREFEFVFPDASTAWFEFSIQPVPEGIFVLSLNITERKEAETAMQSLNEELEQRVRERTVYLEAVNKELEAFSYSVSHDLRAPLRALDGFSQALLEDYEGKLDADGQEYLDLIRYESQRMGKLIDDLIGLSRLNRNEMQWLKLSLSAIVHEIATELATRDPQREVSFSISDDLYVCGDPNLLRVAMQNLLGNAWKYSSKQAHARIEFGCKEEDGKLLYFVRDNGVGFNMAYVHKLFGAFQRLHGMTEFEGTGIGLATVQRIIHRHGGFIRAEGLVNQGASFYFTLGEDNCQ